MNYRKVWCLRLYIFSWFGTILKLQELKRKIRNPHYLKETQVNPVALPVVSAVCCKRSDFWHCWFSVWPPLLLRTVCRGIAWRATGWAAVPTITPWPYSPLSSVSLVCCHSADTALYWKNKTKRTNIKCPGQSI